MFHLNRFRYSFQQFWRSFQDRTTPEIVMSNVQMHVVRQRLVKTLQLRKPSGHPPVPVQAVQPPDEPPDPLVDQRLFPTLERWFRHRGVLGLSLSLVFTCVITFVSFLTDWPAFYRYYIAPQGDTTPIVLTTPTTTPVVSTPLLTLVPAPFQPSVRAATATEPPLLMVNPTATATPEATAKPTPILHEVEEGEHFSCISERYFGTAKYAPTICYYNYELGRIGTTCNELQVGELLIIPTERDSARLPPLLATPGIRGQDYWCVDGETPVATATPLDDARVGRSR